MHSTRGREMNNISIRDSCDHPVSESKDNCESANTDSGFLSGHNLNASEIISSNDTFPDADIRQKATADNIPEPIEKHITETDSNIDSGIIPSTELESCDYGIMDICERFDRLMKRDWMKCFQQDEMGDTSLHMAVLEGDIEFIARLVANIPQPFLNIQNNAAQTALHLAVLMGQPKIVRCLLVAGISSSIRDANGNTALHLACVQGDAACAKELLTPPNAVDLQGTLNCKAPQDMELWNYEGKTCVHLAAEVGSIDILRYLIAAGADVNAREGKSGRSALHISIEQGNEALANFLLDECPRISLEAVTYAGLTAYQLALIQDKHMLVDDLTKRGAEIISPPESEIDSDSEDDMLINSYYGTFSATFPGLSAINVS